MRKYKFEADKSGFEEFLYLKVSFSPSRAMRKLEFLCLGK
jgi:hypothetical protein